MYEWSTLARTMATAAGARYATVCLSVVVLLLTVQLSDAAELPTCASSSVVQGERKWNQIYNRCSGCLQGECPATCCRTDISDTQFYVCMRPGCCLRFTTSYADPPSAIIAYEGLTVAADDDTCSPALADGSGPKCPNEPCALELTRGGLVTCPTGFMVAELGDGKSYDICVGKPNDASDGSSTEESTTTQLPTSTETEDESTSEENTDRDDDKDEDSPEEESSSETDDSSSPSDSEARTCFPAGATVRLANGALRRMDELSIGDHVQVGPEKYSEVFMFTHRLSAAESPQNHFVQLHTRSQSAADHDATQSRTIAMSPQHYLYVNGDLKPASKARVGDVIAYDNGLRGLVTRVEYVREDGLYNPQTLHGDIVVNGIVASTYTEALQPNVAHAALFPVRIMYELFGWSSYALEKGAPYLQNSVSL